MHENSYPIKQVKSSSIFLPFFLENWDNAYIASKHEHKKLRKFMVFNYIFHSYMTRISKFPTKTTNVACKNSASFLRLSSQARQQ